MKGNFIQKQDHKCQITNFILNSKREFLKFRIFSFYVQKRNYSYCLSLKFILFICLNILFHFQLFISSSVTTSSSSFTSIRGANERIVFPKLMADVHHLVVEVIPPTFCQSLWVLVGNVCVSFIPRALMSITINKDKML